MQIVMHVFRYRSKQCCRAVWQFSAFAHKSSAHCQIRRMLLCSSAGIPRASHPQTDVHKSLSRRGACFISSPFVVEKMKSLLVVFLLWITSWSAVAVSVPTGFTDTQLAEGLRSPTALTILPDGRILVMQQDGVVRVIKDDTLLPTAFYAVDNVDSYAERGCLGITSDPNFVVNHFVYLYCTLKDGTDSFNRVLRVTEADDRAVVGSEQVIHTLPKVPSGTRWHMGGALRFGGDGKLYVAVGGHEDLWVSPGASYSQNLANPFGKILRLNADGTIPEDNPYVTKPGAYAANFNLGLRNPFAFDIQPGTGLMYINDVGAGSW